MINEETEERELLPFRFFFLKSSARKIVINDFSKMELLDLRILCINFKTAESVSSKHLK